MLEQFYQDHEQETFELDNSSSMSELDLFIHDFTGDEQEYEAVRESINRYLHDGSQMSDKAYNIYEAYRIEHADERSEHEIEQKD